MKRLTEIELNRKALETRIRAEASIVRLRFLNEVLPAYLAEFDKRLESGKAVTLALPSVDEFITEALKGVKK